MSVLNIASLDEAVALLAREFSPREISFPPPAD